jgi:DNA-binding NarL/FixJ family response regulator
MSEQSAVLVGSWAAMNDRESVLRVGGLVIVRCAAEAAALQEALRDRRRGWLLLGTGLDDATAVTLAAAGRAVRADLRLGLLGEAEDVASCRRWVRRGCSVYLVSSAEPESVRFALTAAAAHEVVIVDRAFSPEQEEPAGAALTRRERDVLELVVTGLRNRDIAAALHVSENTVETHLRNVYSKLHVSTRAEAVEKAIRTGVA